MRSDLVKQRLEDRFRILEKLFEITGGRASIHSIDIRELGQELGFDEERTFAAFEYLVGENLAEWMSLGGFGTITHWGIREVEQAHNGQATSHFPAGIVVVTGGQNIQVVQGHGNTTTMNVADVNNPAYAKLAALLATIESPLPAEAQELLKFSREPETNRFEIADQTSQLADRDSKWVRPLVDFAKTTLSELGAKFLAEAILFGLKGR